MFKLAERRGGNDDTHCGLDGLYLGSSPLIVPVGGSYRVRAADEITALIAAAYGPGIDAARLLPGLRLAAVALQPGDLTRAMIAAVHLRLGEIGDARLARLARAETLLKNNFDPNEPRVPAGNPDGGQWTGEEGGDDNLGPIPVGSRTITGLASWYNFVGRRMANGKLFDPKAMNAAMLHVPLGTVATVRLAEHPSVDHGYHHRSRSV